MNEVLIRRATAGDAAALAAVGSASFREAFAHLYDPADLSAFLAASHSRDWYERALAEPDVALWLATVEVGDPVGYAIAGPCQLPVPAREPASGEVRRLYLRAAAQGDGLGTRLLIGALDWLREQGRAPVYVGVWSGNLGAQRLYARFGFTKVGEYDYPVGRQLDREFILKRA